MNSSIRLGLLGCGNISQQYLNQIPHFSQHPAFHSLFSQNPHWIRLHACCDLDIKKAQEIGSKYNLEIYNDIDNFLEESDCDLIINLTPPQHHTAVIRQILLAGKHVYTEKPLGISFKKTQAIVKLANKKKLQLGCAPDMFLSPVLQQARVLLDENKVGSIHSGLAIMLSRGPESWHPNPSFFYQPGGGPLFDMGPYYLSTLIHLLGPVKSLFADARNAFPERISHTGELIPVSVPTHYSVLLNFHQGATITLLISFDVSHAHFNNKIELYGTEGGLLIQDPNHANEATEIATLDQANWRIVPLPKDNNIEYKTRGLGVCEMGFSLLQGKQHRADSELGLHVVEIMEGCSISSYTNNLYLCKTTCERPPIL